MDGEKEIKPKTIHLLWLDKAFHAHETYLSSLFLVGNRTEENSGIFCSRFLIFTG